MERPSIFVSYAHEDQTRISRLVFALGMYAEVFWDQKLLAGDFHQLLMTEIDNRDIFLLMLSPNSLKSEWCKKELDYAIAKEKTIALARITDCNTSDKVYTELVNSYTYADFVEDFEAGFRRLTQLVFNYPHISWESVISENDSTVISILQAGYLPAVIAKEISEWCIVECLWEYCREAAFKDVGYGAMGSRPRTINGVHRNVEDMKIIASSDGVRAFSTSSMLSEALQITAKCIQYWSSIRDDNHVEAGRLAGSIFTEIRSFTEKRLASDRNFKKLFDYQNYLQFDTAEKLRELILMHSRRSRYLY